MKVIKGEIFPSDVDGTLTVREEDPGFDPTKKTVPVWDVVHNTWICVQPNLNTIRLLQEKKHQGYTVIVWSQGGAEWAEAVVNAVGLRGVVDFTFKKPKGYVDDLPSSAWMGEQIFIPADRRYKQ